MSRARQRAFFLLALGFLASVSAGSAASPPTQRPTSCEARRELAAARAATGANGRNHVSEVSAFGDASIAGLSGTARFDDDLERGRYARRFKIAVMGSSAEIYDGETVWAQDISGGVRPIGSPYARRQTVTNAYLARRGYFDQREVAAISCLAPRVDGPATYDVIRVQPRGGIPADLEIDRRTHLLFRVSLREPLRTNAVTYTDYRRVDGLVLPFEIASGTAGAPSDDYTFSVTRYVLATASKDRDFAEPLSPRDARMLGGAASTTVPMTLEGHQLLIWASIGGRAPMPFILDTGGHAILTSQAARALGLRGTGAGASGGSGAGTISTQYTRVASIAIGKAELLDQPMLIIPYPYSFYERGKKTPLAGIIGLEFFERFATRLDYGDRSVTFAPLASFRHAARGNALPFTFESNPDDPMVNAAADGHAGLFGVDTGNAGNLILFGAYLARTGLMARYTSGAAVIGQGTGGSNAGRLETLHRFTIGNRELHDVTATFTQMESGAFAARTQAGNLGFSILSRFIPTFDYADRLLYLDPERRDTPIPKNRSGLSFTKNEPSAFEVLVVRPGSAAAAAGIIAGDRIVRVDGNPATNYSWADLTSLVTRVPGSALRLRIRQGSTTRDVILTLR
ncbi:MAG TPA: aspartyl protease family protein [Candidatus Tumulicola sp.]